MSHFRNLKKWLAPFLMWSKSAWRGQRTMKLLNLGCGGRYHPDWVNVDFYSTGPGVIAHDLKRGLPFSEAKFDVVYHSHLLEHLPKNYAPIFLQECYRVLKPGGIIRVVVPDLEQIARLYLTLLEKALQGDNQAQARYEWILLEMFDQMVRQQSGGNMLKYWQQRPMPAEDFVIERLGSEVLNTLAILRSTNIQPISTVEELEAMQIGQFRLSGEVHQWMYDRYSLSVLLQAVGFQNVKVCQANESNIANFNVYLLDLEADGSVRKPDSLFIEAYKPSL